MSGKHGFFLELHNNKTLCQGCILWDHSRIGILIVGGILVHLFHLFCFLNWKTGILFILPPLTEEMQDRLVKFFKNVAGGRGWGQCFSQKGVQASCGLPLMEQISYDFIGKWASTTPSFQCLTQTCDVTLEVKSMCLVQTTFWVLVLGQLKVCTE